MSDNYQKYKVEMDSTVIHTRAPNYICSRIMLLTDHTFELTAVNLHIEPGFASLQPHLNDMILVAKSAVTRITNARNFLLFFPSCTFGQVFLLFLLP